MSPIKYQTEEHVECRKVTLLRPFKNLKSPQDFQGQLSQEFLHLAMPLSQGWVVSNSQWYHDLLHFHLA